MGGPAAREGDRRIEEIFTAAERSAQEYAQRLGQEADARARKQLSDAQVEAQRIREQAQAEVLAYLSESRRRIDAYAADRVRSISELTDRLVALADEIEERFAGAATVRRQLNELVTRLGEAAEAAAAEVDRPEPKLPSLAGMPVPRIRQAESAPEEELPSDLAPYTRGPGAAADDESAADEEARET